MLGGEQTLASCIVGWAVTQDTAGRYRSPDKPHKADNKYRLTVWWGKESYKTDVATTPHGDSSHFIFSPSRQRVLCDVLLSASDTTCSTKVISFVNLQVAVVKRDSERVIHFCDTMPSAITADFIGT